MIDSSINIRKSDNAFEKYSNEHLVLVNSKYNALFLYERDVKVVWDLLNNNITFGDLFKKLIDMGYDLDESDLFSILEILIKSGLVECESLSEDIEYIYKNNKLYDYTQYSLGKGFATSIHIELTNKCNLKCIHCYHDEKLDSLSFEELDKLFSDLRESQIVKVTLSGGEIGVLPYWRDIVKSARKNGLIVTVLSNFTLFTEDDMDFMVKMRVNAIKVSLYSYNPETHDKMTGVKGSYEKTIKMIKYLSKFRLKVIMNCPVIKTNVYDAYETKQLASSLGLDIHIDYKIFPSRENTRDINSLIIDKADYKFLEEHGLVKKQEKTSCGACASRVRINQCGEVYCCEFMNISLGNIRTDNIIDILTGEKIKMVIKKINEYKPEECNTCEYDKYCSQCPALVWSNNDFNNEKSPLTCYYTKLSCE